MSYTKRIASALSLIALLVGAPASGQESNDKAVALALPTHLRVLLIEEMQAVLQASSTILDALVRGQDELVAKNAQAIHDSFIMAKKMTQTDREALHSAVPHSFAERDASFHELSARLAEAARARDRPRQRELFAEMVTACVECHAAHATNRFPELAARTSD